VSPILPLGVAMIVISFSSDFLGYPSARSARQGRVDPFP
jgi:hypothetical protein